MKRLAFLALLSFWLAWPVLAADPVPPVPTPPAPVPLAITQTQPKFQSLIDLAPTGAPADAGLLWSVFPPIGVESVTIGQHFVFSGPTGSYSVSLQCIDWTARKITQATIIITIGTPAPAPNPQPNPVPAPSTLTATLQAAYAKDTDSDRAKSLAFLQSAYSAMAALAPSRTDIKTASDAMAWMRNIVEAAGVGLTDAQVKNLRTAIGAELSTLGTGTLNLQSFAAELVKISSALQGVK